MHEIDKMRIIGTAVFDSPSDELVVSVLSRVLVHVRVACAPLLPRPSEDMNVPPLGRPVAGAEIPRTPRAPQPLQHPQMTKFRGLSTVTGMEGVSPLFQPFQNMKMFAADGGPAHALVAAKSSACQPPQDVEVSPRRRTIHRVHGGGTSVVFQPHQYFEMSPPRRGPRRAL
eukprot:CAMPEP_0194340798 /NCGR_PEP_ID=MMETSP0171-20130528/87597_1 /TAXON_ID=218684 /ORGANISM="Corethron pennatum, Strain L29A3" /LENGTH=170 /DNA_ID=CAMNT_0039105893 /DNA_START=385 /DNA_END=894 /DNA_ORIENTATION=+